MATISIIAAIQKENRALGKDGKLLWTLPEDLKHFKKITTGHPIIMGRKTFESIGRPLPQRTNIIVSSNKTYTQEGALIASSLEDAIKKASATDTAGIDTTEIFLIGGQTIYEEGIKIADKLYLTLIDGDKPGDVFFPEFSEFKTVIKKEEHLESVPPFIFLELTR